MNVFYFLLFFFQLLLVFQMDKRFISISNSILIFISFFLMFFLAAFRYGIATDYWSYYNIFLGENIKVEKGYLFLQNLIKFFGGSFNVLIFSIAFLSMWTKYAIFKTYRNPLLAIFLYFTLYYIHLEYNGIRQGFAIAFLLYGIEAGIKRNKQHFLFYVLLSSLIHISSLFFLIVYPLCVRTYKISYLKLLFILLFTFIFKVFLLDSFVDVVMNGFFQKFSTNIFINKLSTYFVIRKFEISMGLIRRILILLFYMLLTNNKEHSIYFVLYILGIIIYMVFSGNAVAAYRLSLVFDFFSIPLFAKSSIKMTKKNAFLLIGLFLFLSITFVSNLIQPGYVLPYRTYLFGGM